MGRAAAVDAHDLIGHVLGHDAIVGPCRRRPVDRTSGPRGSGVSPLRCPAVRVVSGRVGGFRLVAPAGTATRPTSDRVREAVFNSLGSMGVVAGARVVDLFAGSGALAIEAVSRGAAVATCVENDPVALDALRRNVSVCALFDEVDVVRSDVDRWLDSTPPECDLAFIDPPYSFDEWERLLDRVPATLVVIESDRPIDPPAGWHVLRQRTYGGTVVTIATRDDGSSDEETVEMTE